MSGHFRRPIDPTRWEGVNHDALLNWVTRGRPLGELGASTRSLHGEASNLATDQGRLAQALQLATAARDRLGYTAEGPAVQAATDRLTEGIAWLEQAVAGSTAIQTAVSTVAQGFDQVVMAVQDLPKQHLPARFDQPDTQLSWVVRAPLAEVESETRRTRGDLLAAMRQYEDTTGAQLATLPGFGDGPRRPDGGAGGVGPRQPGPQPLGPWPPGPRLSGGSGAVPVRPVIRTAPLFTDEPTVPLEPVTTPVARPRSAYPDFGPTGPTGPVDTTAPDLSSEQTTPVAPSPPLPRTRFTRPVEPQIGRILRPAGESSVFDTDGAVVPDVISGPVASNDWGNNQA